MALISSLGILKQHLEAVKGVGAVIHRNRKACPHPLLDTTTRSEQGTDTLTNNANLKALVVVPPCREIFDGDGPIFNDDGIEILSDEDEVDI